VVAPIENVVRSADLRQQRRPVAWPTPTMVLHDTASRQCAIAIASDVGAPWVTEPGVQGVRLRDLPTSLKAKAGVMELWLPTTQNVTPEQPQKR
jgi:hypothetical protein